MIPDCPDCGHKLDTPRTNDALADDPDNDFFCNCCGGLFTEDEVFAGSGKPWAVVVGSTVLGTFETEDEAQEKAQQLHTESRVPTIIIEVEDRSEDE